MHTPSSSLSPICFNVLLAAGLAAARATLTRSENNPMTFLPEANGSSTNLTTHALSSTHPSIEYLPHVECTYRLWLYCVDRDYVWRTEDYLNEDTRLNRSMNIVSTRKWADKSDPLREVLVTLPRDARDASIFGAPPMTLRGRSLSSQQLCMNDHPCIPLQVEQLYSEAISRNELWNRVRIWSGSLIPTNGSQDSSKHLLRLRNTDTDLDDHRVMAMDGVEYTSPVQSLPRRSPPIEPSYHLEKVTYDATSPWRITVFAQDNETWWNGDGFLWALTTFPNITNPTTLFNPGFTFTVRGSSVQLFAAPRLKLPFPAGSIKVCLGRECELVDTHELYLNLPATSTHDNITSRQSAEKEPLLLWQREGLDYKTRRRVTVTLVEKNPWLDKYHGEMRKSITLHHIAYTRITRGGMDTLWLFIEDFAFEQPVLLFFISAIIFTGIVCHLLLFFHNLQIHHWKLPNYLPDWRRWWEILANYCKALTGRRAAAASERSRLLNQARAVVPPPHGTTTTRQPHPTPPESIHAGDLAPPPNTPLLVHPPSYGSVVEAQESVHLNAPPHSSPGS